jgi:telomerase protein component 1
VGLRSERYGWVQETFNSPNDFDHPENFAWMTGVKKEHPKGEHVCDNHNHIPHSTFTHALALLARGLGISITSMEVWHAVLGEKRTSEMPHAFFAFRKPDFVETVDHKWKWLFDFEYLPEGAKVEEDLKHQYAITKEFHDYRKDMDTITRQIKSSKNCVSFEYSPSGNVLTKQTGQLPNGKRFGTGSVSGLDQFADEMFKMLFTAIDAEYPAYQDELDPLLLSSVQHELMVRSRRAEFVGRDSELAQAMKYVQGENNVPLVIHGPTGTGKSACLAKVRTVLSRGSLWPARTFHALLPHTHIHSLSRIARAKACPS